MPRGRPKKPDAALRYTFAQVRPESDTARARSRYIDAKVREASGLDPKPEPVEFQRPPTEHTVRRTTLMPELQGWDERVVEEWKPKRKRRCSRE